MHWLSGLKLLTQPGLFGSPFKFQSLKNHSGQETRKSNKTFCSPKCEYFCKKFLGYFPLINIFWIFLCKTNNYDCFHFIILWLQYYAWFKNIYSFNISFNFVCSHMELQKVKSCKDNTDLMRYRDLAGEVLLLLLLVLLLPAAPRCSPSPPCAAPKLG